MIVRALVLICVALLGSCAASGPLPVPSANISIIDFSTELARLTSAKNPGRANYSFEGDTTDDYRWANIGWCPYHEDVTGLYGLSKQISSQCAEMGGTYDGRRFCRDSADVDEVLFMALQARGVNCPRGSRLSLRLLEPVDSVQSAAFIERIRAHGYKSQLEITAANKWHIDRRKQAIAELANEEAAQTERRSIAMAAVGDSELGTRICRDGQFEFVISTGAISATRNAAGVLVAQIDGFSDDRSRLRFNVLGFDIPSRTRFTAPLASDPRMGDFFATPGTVYWDKAIHWYVCG